MTAVLEHEQRMRKGSSVGFDVLRPPPSPCGPRPQAASSGIAPVLEAPPRTQSGGQLEPDDSRLPPPVVLRRPPGNAVDPLGAPAGFESNPPRSGYGRPCSTGGFSRSWNRPGRRSAARSSTCSASLEFEGQPLRELRLDAIRYGEQPEVRARLDTAVDQTLDRATLQDLLEGAAARPRRDGRQPRVQRVRGEMERAEARRLQPHYIESFFREAFRQLGGSARQREPRRYQVSHVPAPIRNRDRLIGTSEPVLPRYERIVFEKPLVAPPGQPLAAFVCPSVARRRHRPDPGTSPRPASARRGSATSARRPVCSSPSSTPCRTPASPRAGERRVVSKAGALRRARRNPKRSPNRRPKT